MSNNSNQLYTADMVRELDRRAIEDHSIPGIVLMKRAGAAAFAELMTCWPDTGQITVFCGGGNNGGDGYIIAGLARQRGLAVKLFQLAPVDKLTGDAYRAWQFAHQAGVSMTPYDGSDVPAGGVIVDALLGIGIKGTVRASYEEAIAAINVSHSPVLAVDIPSGLCSDTGSILGHAVVADITVTFIGMKVGLLTGLGPEVVGKLVYRDLNVPAQIFAGVTPAANKLALNELMYHLPTRARSAHKGNYGHVLVIGGNEGFGGAAAMAAEAALRVGAGLVGVATRSAHAAALLARCPVLMVKQVDSGQDLQPLLESPSVIVVGPGLGRNAWSEQVFQQAIEANIPMIVDADALNILSEQGLRAGVDTGSWILTPHPGEAARLLNISNAEVQRDRPEACRAIQQKYGGTILLKGAGTLICNGEAIISLCPYGNPGMASGGMGDVLAGIIGGLLAQGLTAEHAAQLGACLHAVAGDQIAEELGERGMVATDLLLPLQKLVNGK
jgi:ADP-dependent NAD(P)H-hydrate dehydratase / NAD(P)H-hydrate epimerase